MGRSALFVCNHVAGRGRRWLALVAVAIFVASCSDSATGPEGGTQGATDAVVLPDLFAPKELPGFDVSSDVVIPAGTDAAAETDVVVINPGEFGSPCNDNQDCFSALCVPAAVGKLCTRTCETSCPSGWKCVGKPSGADFIYLCLPANLSLCSPCNGNAACNTDGDTDNRCLPLGEDGARFCGVACGTGKLPCPGGYSCEARTDPESGKASQQCVPQNNVCTCSDQAVASDASTSCQIKNFYGTCVGERKCTTAGLSDCSAQVPAQEVCNAKDDDCNGQTDDLQGLVQCNKVNQFGSCAGTASACDPAGQAICNAPEAKPEACNGVDDDCDGVTDEGLCEDGNPCTQGLCNSDGSCQQKTLSGPACDDGNDCTETDKCVQGVCLGSTGLACNDNNPCTTDNCDPIGGGCTHTDAEGACPDDGLPCTLDLCAFGKCTHPAQNEGGACPDDKNFCTSDFCQAGECVHPQAPDGTQCASDGEPCTDDVCVEGLCKHPPNEFAKPCESDGNQCTADVCLGGKCKHELLGPEKECSGDGLPCTKDVCVQGKCTGVPVPAGSACFKDNNPCTDDYCQGGKCVAVANSAPCQDDGNPCTQDLCFKGSCQPNVDSTNNVPCADDANPCTVSKCLNGLCKQNFAAQSGTPCSDNNPCTYGDGCDPAAVGGPGCKAPFTVQCNDGNPCTNDSCDGITGCVYQPVSNIFCSDGDSCTTGDKCEFGTCVGQGAKTCNDGNACTDDNCGSGGCTYTNNASACKLDDNPCTQEACSGGQCVAQPAFDGLPCGADTGNPCIEGQCTSGTCQGKKLDGKACTDGNGCTVSDTCTNGICIGTAGKVCNDNNPCTADSCDDAGNCVFVPGANGVLCNSGDADCPVGQCIGGSCLPKSGEICAAEVQADLCSTVVLPGRCTAAGQCVVNEVPSQNICQGCNGICIKCTLFIGLPIEICLAL